MNNIAKDMLIISALGAAGYFAYQSMSSGDRRQMKRDARRTVDDMCDLRQDMTHMAGTIKDNL